MIPARPAGPEATPRPAPAARSTRGAGLARGLARLAPPAALVALAATGARFAVDAELAPARLYLALVAAAALAAAALAAGDHARWLPFVSALVAPVVLLVPVESPFVLALVFGAAGAALAAVTGELVSAGRTPRALELVALATGAQLVVHADRLWSAPVEPRSFVLLALVPALAGAALALVARERSGLAVAAGLASFAAGPGWSAAGVAALAAAALVVRAARPPAGVASLLVAVAAALPAWGDEPPALVLALVAAAALAGHLRPGLAALGRGALAAAALAALFAGAPPWRRAAPVATVAGALVDRPFGRVELPLGRATAVLSRAAPKLEVAADGRSLRALVVDSFLAEGAGLPCGTTVARLHLLERGRRLGVLRLRVGAGAGDWAALRPDVASRLGCRAGPPFALWLPRGGRHFGARWRARLPLDPPAAPDRIDVVLDPGLPRPVRLALVALAGER